MSEINNITLETPLCVCTKCALQIRHSIRFWKQYLHTCRWFYVIPTPWNVKKSLSYFTPIENKFFSQFREPSLATTGNPLHLLATEDLLLTPQLVGAAVTGGFAQKSISHENLPGIKLIHPIFVCRSLSLMRRNRLGRHKGTSARTFFACYMWFLPKKVEIINQMSSPLFYYC